MSILPVNAVFSGLQTDGHYLGTPALVIQLMNHPLAAAASDTHDGAYPLPEWDLDPAHEISFDKLLTIRGSSPRFSYVGTSTLSTLALSYRERHVVIVGRELGLHDVVPLAKPLLDAGRTVQIETTAMAPSLLIDKAWITLLLLPSRDHVHTFQPENASRPNEVLACVRWRSDLDRAEATYANRRMTVWLQPSAHAEVGVYRQCLAVATRHAGWRVIRPSKIPTGV